MKRLSNRAIALAALVGAGVACLACAKSKIQIDPNKEGISLCASQDEFADDTSGFNMATNKTSEMNKMSKASKAASRATEKEFQTGDVMGVYVHTQNTMPGSGAHSSNMKYVAKSASDWQASSALGGVLTAGSTYYVTGYYPFKSVVADPTKVAHTVAEDQSAAETTTATALEKSDFMSSAAAQMTGDLAKNPSAILNFKHRLAKLVVSVGIPTQIDGGMVSGVKSVIIGGTKIGCEVNITQTAGTVTATGVAKNITPRRIEGSGTAGAITKYEAIVVPQTVTAEVDLVRITCATTNSGDKDLTYKVPTGGLTIGAGVKLTLTLSSSADLAFLTGLDLTSGLAQTNLPLKVKIGAGKTGALSSNQAWITLSKTSGGSYAQSITGIASGEQTVYVKVDNNNSTNAAPREAMLSLTDNMSGAATYPVVQNYYRFSVSATSVQIDKEGTAVALPTVDANQVWTISATLPAWLKIVQVAPGAAAPVWSGSTSVAFPYSVIGDLNPSGKVTLYAVASKTTQPKAQSHSISFNGTGITITQAAAGPAINPPTSNDYITIGSLKWTKGNLIAVNSHECKVGAPSDGGLYFQFGSLIGWKGGSDANGYGIGQWKNGSTGGTYWGSSFSWSTEAAVWPEKFTNGPSGIGSTWPQYNRYDNVYFFGYKEDPYATGGQNIRDFTGFANGDLATATTAVGDPCSYYLGTDWRMPTREDFKTLCRNAPAGTGSWNSWSQVGGQWATYSPSVGGWINGTSFGSNGLFFPASGYRNGSIGSVYDVTSGGHCWSSSVFNADHGYYLHLYQSNGVIPWSNLYRSGGFPVRCVQ